nr:helix-turn-helix transcriptional regulator [Nocardiopsis alba]
MRLWKSPVPQGAEHRAGVSEGRSHERPSGARPQGSITCLPSPIWSLRVNEHDADSLCTESKKALGVHLKRLRKAAGLSGYRLSGVDQSTVSRIETGRIRPSHELLTRLLDAYEADQEGREQAYLLWDQAQLPLQTRRRQVEGTRPAWDQAARPACGPTLLAGASAAEDAARYLTRAQWAGNSPARRNALLDDAEGRLVQVLAALHAARTRTR